MTTATSAVAIAQKPQRASILAKMAERFSVEPNKLLDTLKATAFKGNVSNEQMIGLLIVADQYKLNPFTKEIYAFPDKNNGIVPVVGVDGWSRIINEHPQFDGINFSMDAESCTCTIYRKDRTHPISVTEYMAECKRDAGPWKSHPRRMLRHKATIQCARLAFGFAGIFDEDEAERIKHMGAVDEVRPATGSLAAVRSAVAAKTETIDLQTGEVSGPTFDLSAGLKRIAECNDLAILQLIGDEVQDMPDGPEREAMLAALVERDNTLAAARAA